MARYSISRTSNGSFNVPNDVKCITYIMVGGGGGGAYPNTGFIGSGWTSPQAGGTTYISPGGVAGYGGGPGSLYSGGYGGSSNWRNGQRGGYSYGPTSRAQSGYSSYGQGGAGQWRSGTQSYGGGGGGASCCVRTRGSQGAVPGQRINYYIGYGGTQGGSGNCRYGIGGVMYACVCQYDPPSPSISASPTAFRLDGGDGNQSRTTLTWSTAGGESDSEILESLVNGTVTQSYGQVARNNSSGLVVSPTETTDFRLTTSNPAYTRSDTVTVRVYIPPVITFTVDNDTLVEGEGTVLRWSVTGDANTMYIEPGIGLSQLNSIANISPSLTTTYTATASGLGGTSSKELTVTVLPPPTLSVGGPLNVNYGENILVNIYATNSDGGVSYVATYTDVTGQTQVKPSVLIPNTIGDLVESEYTVEVDYGDFGPENVSLAFYVDGYGSLGVTEVINVPVIIDQTPDYIEIPETDDTIRNEEPVVTPDVEVTTQQLVIEDIDIPVEIKSDYPIQVEIDNDDQWRNIRQI